MLHWALGEEERFARGKWEEGRTGIPGEGTRLSRVRWEGEWAQGGHVVGSGPGGPWKL